MALRTGVVGCSWSGPAFPVLTQKRGSRSRSSFNSICVSHPRLRDTVLRQRDCRNSCFVGGLPLKATAEIHNASVPYQDVLTKDLEALAAEVTPLLNGTCLYLIGMMGSGKSTVGNLVASLLGYQILDVDGLIQDKTGRSVPQIFAEEGEQSFRDLETQVLQELMTTKDAVVSTGGGAVIREENWGYMSQGVVIWLTGPAELLSRRALQDGTKSRPLLSANSSGSTEGQDEYAATLAKVTRILGEREHLYARADLHISLGVSPEDPGEHGATPADVAYRLLSALAERLKKEAGEQIAAAA
ncbi:Shikimate kinase [Coccomyxa sp. Obi]|nr:Shikimate kinase [Coccomyxa sp. Obi]